MANRLPLPTLLSFALVAFTLEFDNESEHRLPHWTTNFGASADGAVAGPWLVSMVMWLNCLRFVPETGIHAREVERLARTRTNWDGMRRWGYVYFEPDPADNRPRPPQSALIVRATSKGRMAQGVLGPLVGDIEERWSERFGAGTMGELRSALSAVADQQDGELPDCMPILKYGLFTEAPQRSAPSYQETSSLPLPALLARILVAFALEFECESEMSLAICANVLRVIAKQGTAVRDLPSLGGVSKEAVAMALTFLTKRGFATIESIRRGKTVLLTSRGSEIREAYPRLVEAIEARWALRYGAEEIGNLPRALKRLAGDGTAASSPLFGGLEPYPESWRAKVRKPGTLPHYPMVLHRGGYPDGS